MRHIHTVFLKSLKGVPEYQMVYDYESMEYLGRYLHSKESLTEESLIRVSYRVEGFQSESVVTTNEVLFNTEE